MPEKDIEVVWHNSRGVKVRGEWAYKQGTGDDLGCLVGSFEYIELDYL